MIRYPDDRETKEEATHHGLDDAVLIRDLVRIVEVLNLKRKDFFSKRSVLAGSMALRCFGSPRFTVYDADFSTSSEAVTPPELQDMLRYGDDDLEIDPKDFEPHDAGKTAWQYAPINYTPIFTSLVPDRNDRTFKADVSFRGLEAAGLEVPLSVPYSLNIWDEAPIVWVMDPHETVAEKILGWCAHRGIKHYADLGFVAVSQANPPAAELKLNYGQVLEILDEKLKTMKGLQPTYYAGFSGVDGLIGDLGKPAQISGTEWKRRLTYIASEKGRFTPNLVEAAVREILVPGLRRARPR